MPACPTEAALLSLILGLIWVLTPQETADAPAGFNAARAAYVGSAEQAYGPTLVAVGRSFLGVPYVGGTLDRSDEENLVVNLEEQDCFTFVEYCLAMTHTFRAGGDYGSFLATLERLRYRGGVRDGYASRLHYTSEWSLDNATKGFLTDVTVALGGQPYDKRIQFMTHHRAAYRQLASDEHFHRIQALEQELAKHAFSYIPEERLRACESQFLEGDILALTTSVEGLDIAHVGFATFVNGRLHMLHASSKDKRVEVTVQPLEDYLVGLTTRTGVMVFRPR